MKVDLTEAQARALLTAARNLVSDLPESRAQVLARAMEKLEKVLHLAQDHRCAHPLAKAQAATSACASTSATSRSS